MASLYCPDILCSYSLMAQPLSDIYMDSSR